MDTKDGVYEAYELDYRAGTIGGYKCFPVAGESNPFRTFKMAEVNVHNMREK